MIRVRTAATVMVATALAVVPFAGSASAAPAAARAHRPQAVAVTGDGSHVTVNHARLHAGRMTFAVKSTSGNGSSITMFRPRRGHTLAEVFADLQEEFAGQPDVQAKGTRDLVRDTLIYGLADVSSRRGARVTRHVGPGTYYLMDLGTPPAGGPPPTTRIRVFKNAGYRAAADRAPARATVRMTSSDRFRVSGRMPAHGTVRVVNTSDTLHFMALVRVKQGTTDRQIQEFFDSGDQGQPPFAVDSPQMGTDVLTPGKSLRLTYRLHRGTYALLCFISDDKTGMPHAVMGMHKVVRLH
ncbi:MAG: putative secreted protein [Marmoricola sp.]|nr:putative secreted protein [Marmoricola sp.]